MTDDQARKDIEKSSAFMFAWRDRFKSTLRQTEDEFDTFLSGYIASLNQSQGDPVAWRWRDGSLQDKKWHSAMDKEFAEGLRGHDNGSVFEVQDLFTGPAFVVQPKPIDHIMGEWYTVHNIDEMQAFYQSRLSAIRNAAREHGYAIGLHGSERRDFDLMAMQWRDNCSTPDDLAHAIANAACGITRNAPYQWEEKPSKRIATSIPICWTDHSDNFDKEAYSLGCIDLSIISPKSVTAEYPVAWLVLDCVRLKPCSVTLDRDEVLDHRPEHVVELFTHAQVTENEKQLRSFYNAENTNDLLLAMSKRIEKLQTLLPKLPDMA